MVGPGPIDLEAAREVFVPAAVDPLLPVGPLNPVARACRRRMDRRVEHFVARLGWDVPSRVSVRLFGDFGKEPLFACGSGQGQAGVRELASAMEKCAPPRALFVLISGADSDGLAVRATDDGEAALKLLHVTEHRRLLALGLVRRRREG
jgi:hypothetical protein